MRTMLRFALAASLLGWSSVAWADCPTGQVLKRVGSVLTANGNISTVGQEVAYVSVNCGGTACVAGFYNGDTLGVTAAGDLVLEVGAIANASASVSLMDAKINFSEGVTFVGSNVTSAAIYSCQVK